MTKAKQLILHAGLPKTATTSIQNTLFRHREGLAREAGIYYPGDAANHTNALCTAFLTDPRNHISNKMAGLTDLEVLKRKAAEIRDGFAAEITGAAPEKILFSAEGMSNLRAEELAEFRDWALELAEEIRVFYIVRNPLRFTTSVMQQHLKGGEVLEDMYADPPVPNFKGRMSAAIAAFGRDNVEAYTFEEMVAHKEGAVGFFLDVLGVGAGDLRQTLTEDQSVDNESLSHEAALILSSLNRQRPAFVNGERGPNRTLTELGSIESIRGVKFRLPPKVHKQLAETCGPDIAWLKENFGIDTYDNAFDAMDEPITALSQQTINSLAMLVSNLLNDRYVNQLLHRAPVARNKGDSAELERLAREVQRVTPSRKVPPYLEPFIEKE